MHKTFKRRHEFGFQKTSYVIGLMLDLDMQAFGIGLGPFSYCYSWGK